MSSSVAVGGIIVSLLFDGEPCETHLLIREGYFFKQGGIFSGFFFGGVDGSLDGGLNYCGICGFIHSGT